MFYGEREAAKAANHCGCAAVTVVLKNRLAALVSGEGESRVAAASVVTGRDGEPGIQRGRAVVVVVGLGISLSRITASHPLRAMDMPLSIVWSWRST